MKRLWPNTLIGQMILILLAGLVASHLVVGWIYSADRVRAVRAIGGYAAAQRIANLARLIDEAPQEWRARLIAATADPRLRITLSVRPPAAVATADTTEAADLPIHEYLLEQLPAALAARMQVVLAKPLRPPPRPAEEAHHMAAPGPMLWRRLVVTFQLDDAQWLTFTLSLPDVRPPVPWPFLWPMTIMAVIVVLACVWAVRRVTAPLGVVVRAAERLGHDVNAPPIRQTGTREMRQAAAAFNEMQGRLQRLLRNRTTMLAALSHDLRTPLTLLRLRIESLPETEERERMLASIATLDAMIDATLKFARDSTAPEDWHRTDIAALLASIVDDMEDAGLPVTMAPAGPVVLACQAGGLRRAVTNLVDNGLKYGSAARLALETTPEALRIVIEDDGPGIPEAELRKVFEPFYRLEESRSRETGGSGLGLAIAQAVAEAHHGGITLANRPEGGLRAVLTIPRVPVWTDRRGAGGPSDGHPGDGHPRDGRPRDGQSPPRGPAAMIAAGAGEHARGG